MSSRFSSSIAKLKRCVQVWAGLRGAVGLSLGLFLLLDNSIEDLRYRTLSFFFIGMMVRKVDIVWRRLSSLCAPGASMSLACLSA